MAYIDTYKAVKTLIDGGFNEGQAEAIVDIMNNTNNTFAIKGDMVNFRGDLKSDIYDLKLSITTFRNELKTDIHDLKIDVANLRSDLKLDMSNKHLSTTKWIAGLYVMAIILYLLIATLIIKIPIN